MSDTKLEKLRYPIGRFQVPNPYPIELLQSNIASIKALPALLKEAVQGLSKGDLELQYKSEGWTIREVVHHITESHTHAYIRFKWALTEDEPLIKVYNQDQCAALEDYNSMPVQLSLDYLDLLHQRWIILLESMSDSQFDRKFEHPDWKFKLDLKTNTALYAWHGKHHLAHIELAKSNRR